jgi:hypothetical protein
MFVPLNVCKNQTHSLTHSLIHSLWLSLAPVPSRVGAKRCSRRHEQGARRKCEPKSTGGCVFVCMNNVLGENVDVKAQVCVCLCVYVCV